MKKFTFEMWAAVTVEAVSEAEAKADLIRSCHAQEGEGDVDYSGVGVYLSPAEAHSAKLVEEFPAG
jgi:hypothetical protein